MQGKKKRKGRGARRRSQAELPLEVEGGEVDGAVDARTEAAGAEGLPATEPGAGGEGESEAAASPVGTAAPEPIADPLADPAPAPPAVFEFVDRPAERAPSWSSRRHRPKEAPVAQGGAVERPRAKVEAAPLREVDFDAMEANAEGSEDPLVLVEVGEAYLAKGRYSDAERWLKRAQRLDPSRADVRARLGIVAFRRGLFAQAEGDLHWACLHAPEDAMAQLYRGEALNVLGRFEEAIEAVEAALRLDAASSRAHYLMGILLDRTHRYEEAGAMYRRARELAPK